MNNLPSNDLMWHYTNAEGVYGIISNHIIRASSAAFMNDANELRTGQLALQAAFAKVESSLTIRECELIRQSSIFGEPSLTSMYLISASKDRDVLTLWRNYGLGQVPYALGFDRAVKLLPVELVTGDGHPSPPDDYLKDAYEEINEEVVQVLDPDSIFCWGGDWHDVTYISGEGDEDDEKYIRETAKVRAEREESSKWFLDFGSMADSPRNFKKDKSFCDEREVRVVIEVNPSWKFISHRTNRFGLVPYAQLSSPRFDKAHNEECYIPAGIKLRLPLRSVMIGPSDDTESKKQSLRLLLDDLGYGDVNIETSAAPFR